MKRKVNKVNLEVFLRLAAADAARAGVGVFQFIVSLIIMAVEEVHDDRPNKELNEVIDSIDVKLPPRRLKGGGEANPACPLPAVREYLLRSLDLPSLKGEVVQLCIDSPNLNPRVVGLAVFGNLTRPAAGRRKILVWIDVVRNVQTFRQIAEASGVRVVYHELWVREEWPRLRPAVVKKVEELDRVAMALATEILKGKGLDVRLALREVTLNAQKIRQAVASVDRWYEKLTGSKPAPEPEAVKSDKPDEETEFDEFEQEKAAEPAEFEEFEEEPAAEPEEAEAEFEEFEEPAAEPEEAEAEFEEFEEPAEAEFDLKKVDMATLNLLVSAGGQLAPAAAAELERRRKTVAKGKKK